MPSGEWPILVNEIAKDPATHGSTFIPILLGSDKTTVSVTTRQNDYYPLYTSISNVQNNVCCAHRNAVTIVGFLAIPKTTFMTVPEVVHFGDGHFQCVIYGLGPYIADYPEQVVLSCIVSNWSTKHFLSHFTDVFCDNVDFSTLWYQWGVDADVVPFTNNYPRADIHELLSPDILHQLIKGTFKDHLVTCFSRIAAAPSFAGLRRFPQGHGFSQWTGNNSKALMEVYLPAIEGHVPNDVVCAFLEFCYLIRQDIITENTLEEIKEALDCFHCYCKIFQETGVHFDGFSLPRQHSLMHYVMLIRMFGAPNGMCSSITESKYIKAMLLTNQRLDKLAAARTDFMAHEMLERKRACTIPIHALAEELGVPNLPQLVCLFLYDQLLADDEHTSDTIPLSACHRFEGCIKVFGSAVSTFFAPSNPSGIGGMRREHIRSVPSWRGGPGCYNTIFVNTGSEDGMHGMEVVRVLCFFSFHYGRDFQTFPCALVHWFKLVSDKPNPRNGMWILKPSFLNLELNTRELSIIHVNTIVHAALLLPIFGEEFVPEKATFHKTLDTYCGLYVNKFTDHHSFEIVS
ncbi:hypothetical protein BDR03DRAFT_936739 [Suillus americanus]|nr:hypothetical protein BDR03DRAFT_936739 [Suillus americanus]